MLRILFKLLGYPLIRIERVTVTSSSLLRWRLSLAGWLLVEHLDLHYTPYAPKDVTP